MSAAHSTSASMDRLCMLPWCTVDMVQDTASTTLSGARIQMARGESGSPMTIPATAPTCGTGLSGVSGHQGWMFSLEGRQAQHSDAMDMRCCPASRELQHNAQLCTSPAVLRTRPPTVMRKPKADRHCRRIHLVDHFGICLWTMCMEIGCRAHSME